MIELLKKLTMFVSLPDRVHLGLLLIPMLALALFEMFSIALILPVIHLALLGEGEVGATISVFQYLPDVFKDAGLKVIAAIFIAVFIFKSLLQLGIVYLVNIVMYLKGANFSTQLYKTYLHQPLVFHLRRPYSELLRNLVTGCGQAFEGLRFVILIVLDILMLAGIVVLLMLVEPVAISVSAAVLLGFSYFLQKSTARAFVRWGHDGMRYEGSLIGLITETLANIRHIKLSHSHEAFSRSFSQIAHWRAWYYTNTSTAIHLPRLGLESFLVVALIVAALALTSNRSPSEAVSVLGLFGMACFRLMPTLNRILSNIAALRDRTAYINELYADLQQYNVVVDQPQRTTARVIRFDSQIHLANVSYVYPNTSLAAINEFDLIIRPGERIGFVGRSGSGKTTVVDIIMGLLTPTSGTIKVDGVDPSENMSNWQKRIGYVPQNIRVLNDTVRKNIAFGIDDSDIDDDRIHETLNLSRLEDVVETLPNGIDEQIGEGGHGLSAGQIQRLAIARALYIDPQLLVLDEATSALDNETEREITKSINSLSSDMTVLIIAHRLNTVRQCDRLVFMKEGRVTAVGDFDSLIETCPDFRQFTTAGEIAQ